MRDSLTAISFMLTLASFLGAVAISLRWLVLYWIWQPAGVLALCVFGGYMALVTHHLAP